jgi:hypothetical protein
MLKIPNFPYNYIINDSEVLGLMHWLRFTFRDIFWYSFLEGLGKLWGGLKDFSKNQTHDHPSHSKKPQPSKLPCAPKPEQ